MVEVLVKELYSKKNRYISTVIPLCDKLVPVYYDIFRPPLSKKKKKRHAKVQEKHTSLAALAISEKAAGADIVQDRETARIEDEKSANRFEGWEVVRKVEEGRKGGRRESQLLPRLAQQHRWGSHGSHGAR